VQRITLPKKGVRTSPGGKGGSGIFDEKESTMKAKGLSIRAASRRL